MNPIQQPNLAQTIFHLRTIMGENLETRFGTIRGSYGRINDDIYSRIPGASRLNDYSNIYELKLDATDGSIYYFLDTRSGQLLISKENVPENKRPPDFYALIEATTYGPIKR